MENNDLREFIFLAIIITFAFVILVQFFSSRFKERENLYLKGKIDKLERNILYLEKDKDQLHIDLGRERTKKEFARNRFKDFVQVVKENANFRNGKLILPKGTIPQPICDHFDICSDVKK